MSDGNNPWGNRGKKPSGLDDLIQDGIKKILQGTKKKGLHPVGGGSDGDDNKPAKGLNIGLVVIVVIVLFLGFQSFYQIQPGEQGVVLRFGRFHQTTSPGLNFLFPIIEKIIKVDVETIRKEEFGFRNTIADTRFQSGNSNNLESLMLTADLNVIQLNWVVQYKVRDPDHFLFNIEDPRAAVRDISESVIRRLVGNRDFDYVLENREELAHSTRLEMQELLDKYSSGMQVVVVQLQDVNPPDPVRPSFNEVNEADQDKIRLGNEAERIANREIPKAEGVAKQAIEEAQGYAIERVNKAQGDASRFNSVYQEYKTAKKVTKTRMYVETLKASLPNVQEIIILDQGKKGIMPLLNFGGLPLPSPQARPETDFQPKIK